MKHTSKNEFLKLASVVAGQINDAMEQDLAKAMQDCDPKLSEIITYAVFGGGKRVRPLLTLLSSRICGRDDQQLLLLGAAFEYLHIASLTHDDIIDNASRRRGKESLIARFGLAMAILAGDWLLSRSMRIIGTLTGEKGLEIFCRAAEEMVNGEFLQNRCIKSIETTEQQYFDIVRCKTGNLIASACHVGAVYAEADESACRSLQNFGNNVGIAFQIIDDILDYTGDPEVTGKAVGNDFVEGKITLPLIHTLSRAGEKDKKILHQLLQENRDNEKNYLRLFRLVEKYDGFATSADLARELITKAKESLLFFTTVGSSRDSLTMLNMLADYIETRNR